MKAEIPLVDLGVGFAEELINRVDPITRERLRSFAEFGPIIDVAKLQVSDIPECRMFQGDVTRELRKIIDDPEACLIREPLTCTKDGHVASGKLVMSFRTWQSLGAAFGMDRPKENKLEPRRRDTDPNRPSAEWLRFPALIIVILLVGGSILSILQLASMETMPEEKTYEYERALYFATGLACSTKEAVWSERLSLADDPPCRQLVRSEVSWRGRITPPDYNSYPEQQAARARFSQLGQSFSPDATQGEVRMKERYAQELYEGVLRDAQAKWGNRRMLPVLVEVMEKSTSATLFMYESNLSKVIIPPHKKASEFIKRYYGVERSQSVVQGQQSIAGHQTCLVDLTCSIEAGVENDPAVNKPTVVGKTNLPTGHEIARHDQEWHHQLSGAKYPVADQA